MIANNTKKKEKTYILVLLLTIIIFTIGATFAYYSLIASQEDESTILYTGKLEINYIDGIYIKEPVLYPMSKPNYQTLNDVYKNRFTVKSSGTLDQTITIILKVAKNDFASGALKYILFNNSGQEISNGNVQKDGETILASNLFLAYDGVATYTLMIWLDNTNYNQNFEMESAITGQIKIESNQLRY